MKKKASNIKVLKRGIDYEANCFSEIKKLVDTSGLVLTESIKEFLRLLQMPEFAQSMLARVVELKAIFKHEIKTFQDEAANGPKN